jgi:Rod binding domain-containing protein
MTIDATSLDIRPASLPRQTATTRSSSPGFEQLLREAGRGADADKARQVAQQLVADTFIKPVLEQMRETNMMASRFAPGDAERRFGPLLDEHIADRMTQRDGFPLVDAVAEHLMSASAKRLQLDVSNPNGAAG